MQAQPFQIDVSKPRLSAVTAEWNQARSQPAGRLWPVATIYVLFMSTMSACHWPYLDPREPVIEPRATSASHPQTPGDGDERSEHRSAAATHGLTTEIPERSAARSGDK